MMRVFSSAGFVPLQYRVVSSAYWMRDVLLVALEMSLV